MIYIGRNTRRHKDWSITEPWLHCRDQMSHSGGKAHPDSFGMIDLRCSSKRAVSWTTQTHPLPRKENRNTFKAKRENRLLIPIPLTHHLLGLEKRLKDVLFLLSLEDALALLQPRSFQFIPYNHHLYNSVYTFCLFSLSLYIYFLINGHCNKYVNVPVITCW